MLGVIRGAGSSNQPKSWHASANPDEIGLDLPKSCRGESKPVHSRNGVYLIERMTSRIQTLPQDVVHLMAAGEVIDSLAAVVRELAENAVDAGATRITVAVWAEQWTVRLTDNGNGMSLADLEQAAIAHSTSKIRNRQDLWQINSLGFRGEALYSIAQLADLEIGSRSVDSSDGWWVTYSHQGAPEQIDVAAIAPGTVVSVSNLFGNWLPRRASLPIAAHQLRAVQTIIQHLALCHPHVTWQVQQGDPRSDPLRERSWFNIWAGTSPQQILPQLLREVQPTDLQELRQEIAAERLADQGGAFNPPAPSLYLLLGLPDRCHRHRPDWIKVAVNGRVVKLPELEQTIFGAFRRTLPRDRHPVCFLHLHLPPDQVDWNRHPAKAEIYLKHSELWQDQVQQAIAQALRLNPLSLSDASYSERVGQLLKTAESGGVYGVGSPRDGTGTEDGDDYSAASLDLVHAGGGLRAIAQVHSMYILAEHPSGVWLVEQHIAHERVLYEQLCDRWQLVPLDPPILLAQLLPNQVEQLQRLELEVEPFGENLWAVRSAPEPLAIRDDCADALLELSLGGNLDAALVATACRTAIRNGTLLTLPEMQALLDQWQHTRQPRTCPHGRPICLSLEESSLSRFFRRHWVVGKSHGI